MVLSVLEGNVTYEFELAVGCGGHCLAFELGSLSKCGLLIKCKDDYLGCRSRPTQRLAHV